MRDVSFKTTTLRTARAEATLIASPATIACIREGRVPKGDPLPIAKVAAVMAAKKTTDWIPYCHNIPIEHVGVTFELGDTSIRVETTVTSIAKTGVEMEAITAAAAAAINLYDMLKMIDEEMEIVGVKLIEKRGGKSDGRPDFEWTAAVLTVSDRVSAGIYPDESGPIIQEGLRDAGAVLVGHHVANDDEPSIAEACRTWIEQEVDVIVITGGTGIGPRDVTPEAIRPLLRLELPGVAETFRRYGQDRMRTAMLSRALAGIAGSSLILAIPGSPGACRDALNALFPGILHAREMLIGGSHDPL